MLSVVCCGHIFGCICLSFWAACTRTKWNDVRVYVRAMFVCEDAQRAELAKDVKMNEAKVNER